MTVRCQLLVLLLVVSSVVSGPTRSAAVSSNGSSSALAPEGPGDVTTSQQSETPAPVQEPPLTPATVALAPPETTAKTGPEAAAKISLTESTVSATAALIVPTSPASEAASSAPLEASAKQTSPEDPATTEQERCAESAFGEASAKQTSPEDPATTEQERCAESASGEASAKQTSPEDPATTEQERCAESASGEADGSVTETCGSPGPKDTEGNSSNNSCIVDDREYPDGARVSGPQDPCRPCFCHRKRVTCVELRCYTRRGCKPLFKAGICCPTYDHCPPVQLVNASGEVERTDSNPEEDTTGVDGVTTDQLTDESVAGPVAHLVDSSAHSQDDSEDQSTSDHDQDDDDGDDHDHSHRHHREHHMLDPVTPLTSSATTLHPATSFPFLVRGRTGVEVR